MTHAEIQPRRALIDAPGANSASRQRAFHSAKDYETSASQIGDVVAPPPDERRKASLVVADYYRREGLDTGDMAEVLKMLGIHPDQPDWDDGPNTAPTPVMS